MTSHIHVVTNYPHLFLSLSLSRFLLISFSLSFHSAIRLSANSDRITLYSLHVLNSKLVISLNREPKKRCHFHFGIGCNSRRTRLLYGYFSEGHFFTPFDNLKTEKVFEQFRADGLYFGCVAVIISVYDGNSPIPSHAMYNLQCTCIVWPIVN